MQYLLDFGVVLFLFVFWVCHLVKPLDVVFVYLYIEYGKNCVWTLIREWVFVLSWMFLLGGYWSSG